MDDIIRFASPDEAYSALENCFNCYIESCLKVLEDSKGEYNVGIYMKQVFMGEGSALSKSNIHMQYFTEVDSIVNSFADTLRNCYEEDKKSCEENAIKAVKLLLEPAGDERKFIEFELMADDAQCEKLIDYLSTEDLQSVYDMCNENRSLYCCVPSQEKLLKSMEKLLSKRGKPVSKGFGRKIKDLLGII